MLGVATFSLQALTGTFDFEGKTPDPPSTPQLMRMLKNEFGLEGIAFNNTYRHVDITDEAALREVRSTAEELGMYVEGGCGKLDLEEMERNLWATRALGGTVMRTYVGFLLRPDAISSREEWLEFEETEKARLIAIEKLARRHKVKVAVENHLDVTWQEMIALLKHVDSEYLGVTLDIANALGMVQDPVETAWQLAPYTFATHLKDFRMVEDQNGYTLEPVRLGDGDIDLQTIVGIFRATNPEITYSIEQDLHRTWLVPWLNHDFWRGFAERSIHDLIKVMSLIRRDGFARSGDKVAPLPVNEGASIEHLIDNEVTWLRDSVTYAREELHLEQVRTE